MKYTQSIGNLNELKCITKFIELGYDCSIPYGNGAKYDFIADVNGELLKIQCKSCSHPRYKGVTDTDAIHFSTMTQTTNTQETVRYGYNNQQIDYFATSYNDQVYVVPVDECSTSKTLRFKPPQNHQQYDNAEDYEIKNVFSYSQELISSKNSFEERMKDIKNTERQFFCDQCGAKICGDNKTKLCQNCYQNSIKKSVRPSREELKMLIRTMPFIKIGKKFKVTDNAIRKWCDAEGLPRKTSEIKSYSDKEWSEI